METGHEPGDKGSAEGDTMEIPAFYDILTDTVSSIRESQPLLILTSLLLAFLGYAVVKRLLKLALFLAIFLSIYAGLVYLMA
jgi:hypothetical protein